MQASYTKSFIRPAFVRGNVSPSAENYRPGKSIRLEKKRKMREREPNARWNRSNPEKVARVSLDRMLESCRLGHLASYVSNSVRAEMCFRSADLNRRTVHRFARRRNTFVMDEVDLRGADHFRRARVWEARALIESADLAGPPNCSARIKSFLRYTNLALLHRWLA